jgi:eukaryotic-like serine/threonine-protein kinase
MTPEGKSTVIVSPRFRYLGQGAAGELGERLPSVVTTELVNSGHFVVVARQEAVEALTQTINRVASRDFIEAHSGGTVVINQNIPMDLGDADLKELSALHDGVRSRLLALGVDYVVYGKYYDAPDGELRIDLYGLEVGAATLQGAEPVRAAANGIEQAVRAAAGRLAARIRQGLDERRTGSRRRSLAVLPFQSLDPDSPWSSWSSALTEELITALRSARELQLYDRARTRKYRNIDQDLLDFDELRRELQVDLLLLGRFSVNEASQQVRIFARLVQARDGEILESFRLTGGLDDDTQAELARQILQKLEVQPSATAEMRSVHTENVSARDHLRIGLHHFDERALALALHSLREAVRLDPDFVEAHYHLGLLLTRLQDHEGARTHLEAALGRAADLSFGQTLWKLDTGNKILARPVLDGDRVYIGNEAGVFWAADRRSGEVLWRTEVYQSIDGAPHAFPEVVVTAAETRLFGFDPADGATLWSREVEGTCNTDVVGAGELACFSTNEELAEDTYRGRLYAVEASTGELRWTRAGEGSISAPLVMGAQVIAAWQDAAITAHDRATGEELWTTDISGRISSAPVSDGERVYFLSTAGHAMALACDTGQEAWRLPMEGFPADSPPHLEGGILYVALDHRLHALDTRQGEVLWSFDAGFPIGAVAACAGLVLLTSRILASLEGGEHVLAALDPETRPRREFYWKKHFSDTLYGGLTVTDGIVYLGSRDHHLYALNLERAEVGSVRAAEIWYRIGQVHLASGARRKAVAAFEQALELNPTHRDSYRELVETYVAEGRIARAIASQQSCVDLALTDSDLSSAQQRLAEISGLRWQAQTRRLLPMQLFPNLFPGTETADFSPITPSPRVADGSVYIGGAEGVLRRLDGTTGETVWEHGQGSGASIRSSAAVAKGRVYFGSRSGAVHALDATTGEAVWTFPTDGPVDSSPVVDDGTLFVGSDDGNLYALDAESGSVAWKFESGGYIKASPAVASGIVCFGAYDGQVHALDAADGSERWRFATGDILNSSPRIAGGRVFIGADDGHVYAVDAHTGELAWSFQVEEQQPSVLRHGLGSGSGLNTYGFLPSTPVVSGGRVFAGSNGASGCHLYALDAEDGRLLWRYQVEAGEVGSPAVWRDVVFFGAGGIMFHDPHLYAVDAGEGSLLWKFRTAGDVLSAPAVGGDTLYCWCTSGDVYAFEVGRIPEHTPERDVPFYCNRARILRLEDRAEEAITELLRARAEHRDDVAVLAELADCYEQTGQTEELRRLLCELQQLDRTSPVSYWGLGRLYSREGDLDAAIEQFETYIRVQRNSAKALGYLLLGQVRAAKGEAEQALADLQAGVEAALPFKAGRLGTDRDQQHAVGALKLLLPEIGLAHLAAGEPLPTFDLETFVAADPDDVSTLATAVFIGALTKEAEGDAAAADPLYRAALDTSPEVGPLLLRAGAVLAETLHRFERSYVLFSLLHENDPGDASHLLDLAEAALNSGRNGEARELTTRVPDDTAVSSLLVARLLALLACLHDRDGHGIETEFALLLNAASRLEEGEQIGWDFTGTRYALESGVLPEAARQWCLRLIDAVSPTPDPRALLALAGSRPVVST